MAQKRKARELTVSTVSQLTKNMRRITLQGEELAGFPEDADGAYFKLTFPSDNPERPIMRTYTIAHYRPEVNEIDVDFMLHAGPDGNIAGFAAPWAMDAKVGDAMSIFGPGLATFINTDADWFFLAADMTALPALLSNLSRLPADAKGYVVVEIMHEEDKQPLVLPGSMQLVWVVNPQPGSDNSPLTDAIKEQVWLEGQVSVWAACEFKTMKKNRTYFRNDRQIDKSHVYVSSYWKQGLQEEEHKVVKREDAGS